jgi:hypothetical protein
VRGDIGSKGGDRLRNEPRLSDLEALDETADLHGTNYRGTERPEVLLGSSGWCTEIGIAAKEVLV